jgi:hypothetical protein
VTINLDFVLKVAGIIALILAIIWLVVTIW